MDAGGRIESLLEAAVRRTKAGPPGLSAAIHHAMFPGGARVRPRLALAVAAACGDDAPALADAAAGAIEMLHCASPVHDDLPLFDDAAMRRGRPSVHAIYGGPLALLAGDALIVMAFETLALAATAAPARLPALVTALAEAAGAPHGIAAGQAWESEPEPPPARYRCAKTGALFVAAVRCGALAAGGDPARWQALGMHLGEAYQVADDLFDAFGEADEGGKAVGVDAALDRPNAVRELGVAGAVERLTGLIDAAIAAVPSCPGEAALRDLVRLQALRLAPKHLVRSAA